MFLLQRPKDTIVTAGNLAVQMKRMVEEIVSGLITFSYEFYKVESLIYVYRSATNFPPVTSVAKTFGLEQVSAPITTSTHAAILSNHISSLLSSIKGRTGSGAVTAIHEIEKKGKAV